MKWKATATVFVLTALAIGVTSLDAEAAGCSGRRNTGTAIGAVGGGILGSAASQGGLGGTVAGAVVGGVAGNVIAGSNCHHRAPRYRAARHYDKRGVAFYYDRYGRRHYYR